MNKNHIGETVGIYKIVESMPYKDNSNHTLYKGVCKECGFERIARYNRLQKVTECKHIGINGEIINYETKWANHRIKSIFNTMRRRCYNENERTYRWYGAKGIKICDEWLNNPHLFEEWAMQNGYEDYLTIDRRDETKDYSPSNCRWVTLSQNSKYKSTTSLIDVNGEVHSGKDWANILGLGCNRINIYVRKYGLENTIEFIKKYLEHPNLKPNRRQSYYDLYMNNTNVVAV